jgi:hypothetical protein
MNEQALNDDCESNHRGTVAAGFRLLSTGVGAHRGKLVYVPGAFRNTSLTCLTASSDKSPYALIEIQSDYAEQNSVEGSDNNALWAHDFGGSSMGSAPGGPDFSRHSPFL